MSDPAQLPEPDRAGTAPHPRHTDLLFGQDKAVNAFLDAYASRRLHHGWLITGPRGVGKATLAWQIARFLLANEPDNGDGLFGDAPPAPSTLKIDPEHPVARRVAALSDPGLFLVRRATDEKTGQIKQDIGVDVIRGLKGFFQFSAADGGRRVVIVDSADDMTTSAANALLKVLEEPPRDTTLLLVCHQPSRLLPTIRSRCRTLRCDTLSAEDLARAMTQAGDTPPEDAQALNELAGGSVGEAVRLNALGGAETYGEIAGLFASGDLNRAAALKLAESCAGRDRRDRMDLVLRLLDLFMARTARTGAGSPPLVEAAPGEAALLKRLAPTPNTGRRWAELQQDLGARARQGLAVNLDPAALILDMVFKINELAAQTAVR